MRTLINLKTKARKSAKAKRKVPADIIDSSLEKYKDKILFPEKLAKANEMLRTVGLPNLPVRKRRIKSRS